MPDSQNLLNLKAAYTKWNDNKTREKVDAWRGLLADTCQIGSVDETRPGMSFATPRKSKQQALDYLTAIFKEWKMVYFRPQIFVEQGDHVAMFGECSWTHKGTKKTVVCRISNLWTFNGDKAVSMIDLFDSAKAAAAATPDKKQKKAVKKAAKTVGKKAVKQAVAKADEKAVKKAVKKAGKKAGRS